MVLLTYGIVRRIKMSASLRTLNEYYSHSSTSNVFCWYAYLLTIAIDPRQCYLCIIENLAPHFYNNSLSLIDMLLCNRMKRFLLRFVELLLTRIPSLHWKEKSFRSIFPVSDGLKKVSPMVAIVATTTVIGDKKDACVFYYCGFDQGLTVWLWHWQK